MSRVEELRHKFEAELAVVELEERLVALKATEDWCTACGRRPVSGDSEELREAKERLREARREFRLQREGDAVAAPAVIEVATGVASPGGVE